MNMNDEQFEGTMTALQVNGYGKAVSQLRARDTAQREALARVEAERDAERARGDAAVGDANEAEAQLAEAVGLLNWLKTELDDFPSLIRVIDKVLARHAQAEQQEAQGAQAGEFQREDRYIVIKRKDLEAASVAERDWFKGALSRLEPYLPKREYLVIESDWPEYEPTWAAIQARVKGRAALATQPAALPTDPASWPLKVGADEFVSQQAEWPDTDPSDFMHDALYEMIQVLTKPAVRGAEHE